MSQLDDLLGGLLGGKSRGLMAMLVPVLGSLLANGGLSKILDGFQKSGLGAEADSWVSKGANEPVTADQVKQVLGDDEIDAIAKRLGVSHEEAAAAVAEALPEMVDKATPEGEVPPESQLDELFAKISG